MKGKTSAKILIIFILLAIIFTSEIDVAEAGIYGDFEYQYVGSGDEVEITGYTGEGGSINIPSEIDGKPVVSIGSRAFEGKGLTEVTIPDSVTSIENRAFQNNQLTSVIIPDGVTSIKWSTFQSNLLTSVTIPDSVTSIESRAFQDNQLTSVTIPDSVISIGVGTFYSNQLTSVIIPNSVIDLGREAFAFNQLTSVIIGNRITSIEISTFRSNQLTSVIIPNSVTSIGYAAFRSNQLTSVTIPDSVESIGYAAFESNQLAFVVLPSGITSTGGRTFFNNKIESIEIPDGVMSIEELAFGMNQLTSVVIPSSVTSIERGAFSFNQLTSIDIPDSVEIIGSIAFRNNQLTSVVIPSSVTSIGDWAFMFNSQLTQITMGRKDTTIGEDIVGNNNYFREAYLEGGAGTYTRSREGQWQLLTHMVVFNSNGGSVIETVEVLHEAKIQEPTTPTRLGYKFEGWYTDNQDFEHIYDFNTEVTEDVTLFAKWTANTDTDYRVEHYQQNVSGDGYTLADTENRTGKTETTATAEVKTYEGFNENTNHEDRVISGTIAGDGSLVLKLYYDRNAYKITFESAGGSKVAAITQDFDTEITAPDAPTRIGYTFAGWDMEIPLKMPAEDITITALWDINSYKLTVTYVIGNSSDAPAKFVQDFEYMSEYNVESPIIIGYKPDLLIVTGVMGVEDITLTITYEVDIDNVEELVKKADETKDQTYVDKAREWVMLLEDGEVKSDFKERLDEIQNLIDNSPDSGDRFPLLPAFLILFVSAAVVFITSKRKKLLASN